MTEHLFSESSLRWTLWRAATAVDGVAELPALVAGQRAATQHNALDRRRAVSGRDRRTVCGLGPAPTRSPPVAAYVQRRLRRGRVFPLPNAAAVAATAAAANAAPRLLWARQRLTCNRIAHPSACFALHGAGAAWSGLLVAVLVQVPYVVSVLNSRSLSTLQYFWRAVHTAPWNQLLWQLEP